MAHHFTCKYVLAKSGHSSDNADITVSLSARSLGAFNFSASPVSIHKLTSNFSLQRLEILETLNGKTYADLKKEHSPFVSSFKNYILCLRVVKHETDPAGVFEVYQRINTGAENLNAQQIRRAAYRCSTIALRSSLPSPPTVYA